MVVVVVMVLIVVRCVCVYERVCVCVGGGGVMHPIEKPEDTPTVFSHSPLECCIGKLHVALAHFHTNIETIWPNQLCSKR
jgi:hypothetical protein